MAALGCFALFVVAVFAPPALARDVTFSCPDRGDALRRDLIAELHGWCAEDGECAAVFHQLHRHNATVFRHLVEPQLLASGRGLPDFFQPAIDLLCAADGAAALEDVNRQLWLLSLRANAETGRVRCDVNHRYVFHADELRSECVCMADRICSDSLFDTVPVYVIAGLMITVYVFFAVGVLLKNRKILQHLDGASPGAGASALTGFVGTK